MEWYLLDLCDPWRGVLAGIRDVHNMSHYHVIKLCWGVYVWVWVCMYGYGCGCVCMGVGVGCIVYIVVVTSYCAYLSELVGSM